MGKGFKFKVGQYVYAQHDEGEIIRRDNGLGYNRYALDNGKVYREEDLRTEPSEPF